MLRYPGRIVPADEGVIVRFPDIPEAVAVGSTETEALESAKGVLATVLDCYKSEGRTFPPASDICGAPLVDADPDKWRPMFFAGRV